MPRLSIASAWPFAPQWFRARSQDDVKAQNSKETIPWGVALFLSPKSIALIAIATTRKSGNIKQNILFRICVCMVSHSDCYKLRHSLPLAASRFVNHQAEKVLPGKLNLYLRDRVMLTANQPTIRFAEGYF